MNAERQATNLHNLERAAAGDGEAVEELLRDNTGLVNSIAVRFLGRGTELEDLQQIGMMGLLRAIRSFDLGRGVAFSTYAVPLILGEIRRFLRDDGPLKVSRSQKRLGAVLAAERERALAAGEEHIRLGTLAQRCGVSEAEAAAALDATAPVRSLSEPVGAEEEGPTYESILCDEGEQERTLDRIALAAALDKLPTLRRKIVLLRYFRDLSQQQTAQLLGITQVKVSREEKRILFFLRQELS